MYHLAKKCEILATCTLVCIHKNVRGFPETALMRRYAEFLGGTSNGPPEIGNGEFGVVNLDEYYKPDKNGDYLDVDYRNIETGAITVYGEWYGDGGFYKCRGELRGLMM